MIPIPDLSIALTLAGVLSLGVWSAWLFAGVLMGVSEE